jgi:hypothetical protein
VSPLLRILAVVLVLTGVLLAGGAQAAGESASMRFADDRGAVLELDFVQHRVRFSVPAYAPGRAVNLSAPIPARLNDRGTISLTVPSNGLRLALKVDPRRGNAVASVVDARSRWVAGMASGRMLTHGSLPNQPTFTATATPTLAPSATPYPTWTPTRVISVFEPPRG